MRGEEGEEEERREEGLYKGEGERGGKRESQDIALISSPMHTPSPHTHIPMLSDRAMSFPADSCTGLYDT